MGIPRLVNWKEHDQEDFEHVKHMVASFHLSHPLESAGSLDSHDTVLCTDQLDQRYLNSSYSCDPIATDANP